MRWVRRNVQSFADVGGSGDGGEGEAREQCNDKIVMPCDSEEFLAVSVISRNIIVKFLPLTHTVAHGC